LDLEGYATLELGVSLSHQPEKQAEALACVDKLANDRRFKGTYWGGCALFRKALYTRIRWQNASLSLPLYLEFVRQYPNHPIRELAEYYAFRDACKLKDKALANKLAGDFRQKYPKSEWTNSITQHLIMFQKDLDSQSNKQGDVK
jgi:hypothetical protein